MAKMPKKKTPVSEEKKEWYARLVATHPDVDMKGKNLLYTSVNGHMFTMFSTNAKLGIRLGKDDRETFIRDFDTSLLETYGTVMKEYVRVPDSLLPETALLEPYLKKSYAYVTSLKPKPTKRPKK
ncbi:MAG: hypothetical protein OEO79_04240 [Gemmatimonadota bacterium]|nr:hypothetical protein [Gemmatimonadota bacterium]MDH3422337.1 hypothetical protein [Gemmatimonadota bacterium]